MEISINKKALVVSGLSLSLLAGCLDDPYQYPDEVVTPPSDASSIYGPDSDGMFALSVIDQNGLLALVDADGNVTQDNISTSNISGQAQGNLNLRITNNAEGRIQALTSNGSNVDMAADANTSTLQFDLRVLEKPASDQAIYLTAQREEAADLGQVSLTSAMMAYSKAAPQTVKVPLSCFTEAGMDFTDTLAPFVLHSDNNLNVDIGNIRVVTNSMDGENVLACTSDSVLVQPDDAALSNDSKLFVINSDPQGWATMISTWMTDASHMQVDFSHDSFTITHTGASAGANGGIVLLPNDGKLRDMADYVESGVLEFMINIDSYGSHPTKRLQIQMESPNGNSQPYFLDAGFAEAEWQQVRIPLKTLFTKPDGSVDVNVLRNINKPLSLLPEWVEASDTLQGMKYTLAGIKLVKDAQ